MPEERKMRFKEFLDVLNGDKDVPGIFYVQKQNSNFTDEFVDLMKDASEDISWATEALGMIKYLCFITFIIHKTTLKGSF